MPNTQPIFPLIFPHTIGKVVYINYPWLLINGNEVTCLGKLVLLLLFIIKLKVVHSQNA